MCGSVCCGTSCPEQKDAKGTQLDREDLQLDDDGKEKLRSGVRRLRRGLTREEVIALLGDPTHYDALSKKESPEITGWQMIYVISRRSPSRNVLDPWDKYLWLTFDGEGLLSDVDPNNIPWFLDEYGQDLLEELRGN